jgi:transcriptional regulator of acetoin/glycerol metabolism
MLRPVKRAGQTVSDVSSPSFTRSNEPIPGVVLVWSGGAPRMRALAIGADGADVGRGEIAGEPVDDERMSRRHARVAFDGARWTVVDHGSRNGTFVDGARIEGSRTFDAPRVVRVGHTLLTPLADVRAILGGEVRRAGEAVVGPRSVTAWDEIERAGQRGETLLVVGESGVGKELAARAFHAAAGPASAPFVAVNCAAIPEGLAERLLFGARRGAYSGATADAEGYVQSADGGTLFLDEVGDLDPAVQPKLLRVLEVKEVTPLGAPRAIPVRVRVCSATRDLREAVADGRFREDLYFRIGRPEVRLAPLRDRVEEVAWLVAAEVERAQPGLQAHATLVEACMVRAWPGNVRELLSEVRRATHAASTAGAEAVGAQFLDERAGLGIAAGDTRAGVRAEPDRAEIERVLGEHDGNVTRAAKALGMHRNQLRRWLAKNPTDTPRSDR